MVYTRVLVPLDGSPLAEQVLPYVRTLAQGLGVRVELLRVFEPVPTELVDPARGLYIDRLAAAMRIPAQDYLEGVAASLRREGFQVSCSVHEGSPAEHIVREAEREPGTLVAMTTHGRSGLGRWVLGSVTDKVLHATSAPLLVVRARQEGAPPRAAPLTTVIVPLDGSSLAEQVLPHVAGLARALALRVLLVRVAPTLAEYDQYSGYFPARYPDLTEEVEADALAYLQQVGQRLRQEHGLVVEERVLRGYPASAIVGLARGVSDNLVAMTTHGRSGLGRWVLGSVTDRVVRHSGDPVLVVRASAA